MAVPTIEASAPTRVDLAGGTLDIWPLYLFHPGAVTVNVAIDRRAWCRVESGFDGLALESLDTQSRVQGRDLGEVISSGKLPLAAAVLRALGVEGGLRVVMRSRVPAGSGLGGSSALAVALAAAVCRALGLDPGPEELVRLVRDAEARSIGVPTGVQDYWAAVKGGVLGVELPPGSPRAERLATDPGKLAEWLLLVDAGVTRFSGLNNWGVFKARIDGDASVREALGIIADVARRVREALLSGRHEEIAALIAEEWRARRRLGPGVSTPEIDRIAEAAARQGGAAKACGAGGGGMVAVWAAPEGREPLLRALREAGFETLACQVDVRGLEVSEV